MKKEQNESTNYMLDIFNFITKDMDHWKDPISVMIPSELLVKKKWTDNMIIESVLFYTATIATISLTNNKTHISATGYTMGTAGPQ